MFEERPSNRWLELHDVVVAIVARQQLVLPGAARPLNAEFFRDTDMRSLVRKWWLYV